MTDKNWRVMRGVNYIDIEFIYGGKSTHLCSGDTYTVTMSSEGAALLINNLADALEGLELTDGRLDEIRKKI